LKPLWKGLTIINNRYPRIDIHLDKLAHNAEQIVGLYKSKNVMVTVVTKGVCGSVEIANTLVKIGIHSIGESYLQNIAKMRAAGVQTKFMLLRSPMLSETEQVVALADISLNSELCVIRSLNQFASRLKKKHKIILMIEMGDLREGILPEQVELYVEEILRLKSIELTGIGTNLLCFGGIKPDTLNMNALSSIARQIQEKYKIQLEVVSGGNSANYSWFQNNTDLGLINHLRIGENILLGSDPTVKKPIPGLFTNVFQLQAEVIENKSKPSMPYGKITFDAFGEVPKFEDKGRMNRALLAIGKQDLDINGCFPIDDIEVLGSSSDHLLVNTKDTNLNIGDIVNFNITYRALLRLMVSPYVEKNYIY
jgi:ornithine racemase